MSNQPSCVSWLEHLIHLHLKWLLIGMHFYRHFVNYFPVGFVVLFCFFLLLVSSLMVWWFLALCLGFFPFTFCVYIIGFWFVVIMKFTYMDLSADYFKLKVTEVQIDSETMFLLLPILKPYFMFLMSHLYLSILYTQMTLTVYSYIWFYNHFTKIIFCHLTFTF